MKDWTYGLEIELADWDTREGWDGYGRDPEPLIVNSSGIAADPRLISYPFGGELNTPPTKTIGRQIKLVKQFFDRHPKAKITYRCGMQIHIRVPGLINNLKLLKRLQEFVRKYSQVFESLYWVSEIDPADFYDNESYKAARKWRNMQRQSALTVLPSYRIDNQLRARTVREFFEAEVPRARDGKILWHAQRRSTVNLRQLKQTDTIEFRHFHATFDLSRINTAFEWCRDYLAYAFNEGSALQLFEEKYRQRKFCPNEDTYSPILESRWRATTTSKNRREVVDSNIDKIVAGTFDNGPECPEHLRWIRQRKK